MDKGDLWPPSESLPAFRTTLESFAQKTHSIALILLASLAVSLGYAFYILYICTYSVCSVCMMYVCKRFYAQDL